MHVNSLFFAFIFEVYYQQLNYRKEQIQCQPFL